MELNKAQNLIEHKQEIFSRPARTWIAKQDLAAAGTGVDNTFCTGHQSDCSNSQASLVFVYPGATTQEASTSAVVNNEKVSKKRKTPPSVSTSPQATTAKLRCFLSLCVW